MTALKYIRSSRQIVFAFVSIASATASGSTFHLVSSELPGGVAEAGLYRLQDLNNDGDALDVGERVLWGRGLAAPGDIRALGGAILAADATRGQLVQYRDSNGDGDALDIGESLIWADGLNVLLGFDTIPNGTVFAADIFADVVYRLRDENGDLDALDVGERVPYASGIHAPVSALVVHDQLFVASDSGGGVFRLVDINGDGDALDSGENILFSAPGVFQTAGLFDFGSDGLLVSARTTDTVFQVQDLNGDGDALDVVELLSFANPHFGLIDGPWNMAQHGLNGVLLVEHFDDEVSLIRDINGDGDALDIGEVVPWADGLRAPVGILFVPEPSSPLWWLVAALVGFAVDRRAARCRA